MNEIIGGLVFSYLPMSPKIHSFMCAMVRLTTTRDQLPTPQEETIGLLRFITA